MGRPITILSVLVLWSTLTLQAPASGSGAPKDVDGGLKECSIVLVTGVSVSGILMRSSDDEVVVRINGIDTTIDRDRIASIRFLPPIEERYRELRRGIADNDIDARLTLVEWLRKRRAYDLALLEVDSVLEDSPGNPLALDMKKWIEVQIELRAKRVDRAPEPAQQEQPEPESRRAGPRLLSDDEINLIRVYEVDLDDPPRMVVDDGVLPELMERNPGAFPVDPEARAAMLALPPHEQLRVLFANQARDLYPRVRVLEDPEPLALFRRDIAGETGWLTNACATSRCHGGEEAGRFSLVRDNPNSDRSVYTNFMIINDFRMDDGRALIDTSDPARSPLLHLAMLRSASQTPHPQVDPSAHGRDWRPVVRSPRDRAAERVVEWIRSLYTPRPSYGIPDPLDPGDAAP